MQQARKDWRLATSNLRLLLKYDIARALGQFVEVERRGTRYIWNRRTDNIIATIRGGNKTLIRYRANSHYAPIIESYAKTVSAICLPSSNVGRRHRRIRRNLNTNEARRDRVIAVLAEHAGMPNYRDSLTRPRPSRAERRAFRRAIRMAEDQRIPSTSDQLEGVYNAAMQEYGEALRAYHMRLVQGQEPTPRTELGLEVLRQNLERLATERNGRQGLRPQHMPIFSTEAAQTVTWSPGEITFGIDQNQATTTGGAAQQDTCINTGGF